MDIKKDNISCTVLLVFLIQANRYIFQTAMCYVSCILTMYIAEFYSNVLCYITDLSYFL